MLQLLYNKHASLNDKSLVVHVLYYQTTSRQSCAHADIRMHTPANVLLLNQLLNLL